MLKEAPPPSAVEPATAPDHRAQLFSQDQLEAHAARIAETHRLADNPRRGRPLLPMLDESAERLDAAYRLLSTVARTDPSGPPEKLLPRAPQTGRRPVSGVPARLSARARADRAHRRARRSRDDRRLHGGVSAPVPALDRGNLGRPDHAAPRPCRGAPPAG